MKYYAHKQGEDKKDWQLLKDHLTAVAKMSRVFAERYGTGEMGYMAGILHDVGKYSKEFQEKLEGKNKLAVGQLEVIGFPQNILKSMLGMVLKNVLKNKREVNQKQTSL